MVPSVPCGADLQPLRPLADRVDRSRELTAPSAALVVTCYGLGNLCGALLLIVRTLRGVPDVLTGRLALAVAVGLLAALTAPTLGLLVAAYLGTGLLNALFFASTLAARTEYAPAAARSQIFIWVAALKITAGSAGPLWRARSATAATTPRWGPPSSWLLSQVRRPLCNAAAPIRCHNRST